MKSFLTYLVTGLFFIFNSLHAQETIEWERYYNSDEYDGFAVDMIFDNDGNIVVTGYCATDYHDITTIKFNPAGDQLWAVEYSDSITENDPYDMTCDVFNNIIISCRTRFLGAGYPDSMMILKYNAAGELLWQRTFVDSSDWMYSSRVATDTSANIFISVNDGDGKHFLLKYDADGDLIWTDEQADLAMYEMEMDDSSNIYLSGEATVDGFDAVITSKYDANGNFKWSNTYSVDGVNISNYEMVLDQFKNTYTLIAEDAEYTYEIMKKDENGETEWIKRVGGNDSNDYVNYLYNINLDNDGNILFVGTKSGDDCDVDADSSVTVKMSPEGEVMWIGQYTVGECGTFPFGYGTTVDAQNNVYSVSNLAEPGDWWQDMIVTRYDENGNYYWSENYEYANTPMVIIADTGAVYVAATVELPGPLDSSWIAVIKFKPVEEELPVEESIDELTNNGISVYPNPASDIIYFSVSGEIKDIATIDMSGNKIILPFTNNSIDIRMLPAGIYCTKILIDGSWCETKWVKY